jgi:hypothetical protein
MESAVTRGASQIGLANDPDGFKKSISLLIKLSSFF